MTAAGERAPEVVFSPARDLSKNSLAEALIRVLAAREEVEALPEARVKPLITIEEMMDRLVKRVQNAITLSFNEFAAGTQERVDIIVSFLALLELVKQGTVFAEQFGVHGDIHVSYTASVSVPHYG
jgi:chromatin segregation and condensation protein Rec8/ScpA/Scc1 (kleisin family)